MPLHPNVRRCTHIQVTGHRCGSPALKQEYFCYFHTRMIKGVQTRMDSQIHPVALIENAEAIQAAIMHMIDALLKGTIDNKRATIVLKALYIAVRNSRNVYFHIRPDDMVHEVPNYAHQYLSEHPEQNTDGHPDVVAPQPENNQAQGDLQKSSLTPPAKAASTRPQPPASATPEVAAPPKKENKYKEFPQRESDQREDRPKEDHQKKDTHKKECHPERARTLRESKDPDSANSGNGATGNSPHVSKANREKAWGQDIPPLTTRQAERWSEIKKLEASIEGAMHGDWRDLRTVFTAIGLTPPNPSRSPQRSCGRERPRSCTGKKVRDGLSGRGESLLR
jgi:hypothetical protein